MARSLLHSALAEGWGAHRGVDDVARRAGDVGDDGALAAAQRVQQARLADVRPANQRDLQPPLQQPAALGRAQRRLDAALQRRNVVEDCLGVQLHELLREIEAGFHLGKQFDRGGAHVRDFAADAALHTKVAIQAP